MYKLMMNNICKGEYNSFTFAVLKAEQLNFENRQTVLIYNNKSVIMRIIGRVIKCQ